MSSISMNLVMRVQDSIERVLLQKANVVGVAVGYKESGGVVTDALSLVTLVEQKKPVAALSAEDAIPREVQGIPTDVVEIGLIQAQSAFNPRARFRPVIPTGVSIGHYKVTAGTLGAIVFHRSTGEKLILSNNHVLANSNEALVGDAILQPGAIDGGVNPGDIVARLESFIPLNYLEGPVGPPAPPPPPPPVSPPPPPPTTPPPSSGCDVADVVTRVVNMLASLLGSSKRVATVQSSSEVVNAMSQALDNLMDAALARPAVGFEFSEEIRNVGRISGTKPATLGQRVRKSGRTTDYTEGTVTLLNATVNVAYSTSVGQRTGRFTGQVITTAMSQGGDSGSLIVDASAPLAVGLLYAGSPVSTIFTPIDPILNQLNVRF